MIVDCALYHHGVREVSPEDFSDALDTARAQGSSFVWVGLHDPTEAELAKVAKEFSLHQLAVEDALTTHQRPKVEEYADSLFVVLKTVRYDEQSQQIELGDVMLFVGDSFIVTVRHGQGRALANIRKRLEQNQEILDCGPSAVLYAIADKIVDDYSAIALAVEEDIEEVEQQVFAPDRSNAASRIYNLKREVIEFRRAVLPLVDPMSRLSSGEVPHVHEHDAAVLPRRRRPRRPGVGADRGLRQPARRRCSTRTWPRSRCSRTRTCGGSRRGWPSLRCPPPSPASTA